ncbi:MAG: hypothetical protein ABIJ97_12220 [Bacteroidota bacterium]
MKIYFLPICLLLLQGVLYAQHRDLNFYLERANMNSPLINDAKNENKIIGLESELIRSILSKPELNIEAGVLFAPVISHNNGTSRFEWVSSDAINYNGYDFAYSDGGQYQAIISLKQPLLSGSRLRVYSGKADI